MLICHSLRRSPGSSKWLEIIVFALEIDAAELEMMEKPGRDFVIESLTHFALPSTAPAFTSSQRT